VIPEIGMMIGAYIITRMVRLALRRNPREHAIVLACSVGTVIITGVVVADLFSRGAALTDALTNFPTFGSARLSTDTSSPPEATSRRQFGVGDSKDAVIQAQGTPSERGPNAFKYGDAVVIFGANERVVSWTDPKGILRVRK
jgi:hypothetical protein